MKEQEAQERVYNYLVGAGYTTENAEFISTHGRGTLTYACASLNASAAEFGQVVKREIARLNTKLGVSR